MKSTKESNKKVERSTESIVKSFVKGVAEDSNIDLKHKDILKDKSGKRKLVKTISAMSNTPGGGAIIIGVNKSEEEVRYQKFKRTTQYEEDLSRIIRDRTKPDLEDSVQITFPDYNGHRLMRIDIEYSYLSLSKFKKKNEFKPYKRYGSSTDPMSESDVEAWMKKSEEKRKESLISASSGLKMSQNIIASTKLYLSDKKTFDHPKKLDKFHNEPDYYFIPRDSNSFSNCLFRVPNTENFGHRFRSTNSEINSENYEEFIRGLTELILFERDATFSISQFGGNWFGYGVNEFLNCIEEAPERYEEYPSDKNSHSSELAILTGESRFGTFTVWLYYYVPEIQIRYAYVFLQTKGIPYNTYPVSVFLESFGIELGDGNRLSLIDGENELTHTQKIWVEGKFGNQVNGPEVDIIGPISKNIGDSIFDTDPDIRKVVIKNPFYRNHEKAAKEFPKDSSKDLLKNLAELEYLVARLYFGVDEIKDYTYKLRSINLINTGAAVRGQSFTLDCEIKPVEIE